MQLQAFFFEGLQNSRFFHLKFTLGDANRIKREFAMHESVDSHARSSHARRMREGLSTIDLYHSAAMLSLRRIQSLVFAREVSPRRDFSARLALQKQSFLFS